MDFTDLINNLKEYINPGSSAMHTAPGQTYGPAVSRTTHVPIDFRQLDDEASGKYDNRFSSMLGKYIPGNHGQITIDPTSSDFKNTYQGNVTPVVQHEAAHAILEPKLNDPAYDALALKNKQFAPIADKINRAGYLPAEVPAYMSEAGASQRWGVPQNIVDIYRQQFQQGLDPATAAAYGRNLGK